MAQGSIVFDRAVEYYDQTRGFPPGVETGAAQLFVQAGRLTPQSRVLEVGVGTGRIALPLAPHVGSYTGLDLSLGMMLKLIEKQKGEPVRVVQGDAAHLPFAASAFDAAVAVHFFHLVPGWRDTLTELKRVLRPGGVLMHGWNAHDADDQLDTLWHNVSGRSRGADAGVPFEQRKTFLPNSGWLPVGEERIHHFTVQRSPQTFIDNLRARLWSQTWTMPDDVLNERVAIVEAFARENYADPTAPVTLYASFHVQAYKPY